MTRLTPGFPALLREALARRDPATLVEEGARRAAVAVVVTEQQDPSVLLVKRRERAGDPWSGQAAFPGGFQSAADRSATATAERETEEETGLALARFGEHLGRLDDAYPRSIYVPRVIVTPVVFAVPWRLEVSPRSEVDHAIWVPARELFDAANRKPFVLSLPTGALEFDSIRVRGLVIWGLTERILAQMAIVAQ